MSSPVYKAFHLPPDGEQLIVDTEFDPIKGDLPPLQSLEEKIAHSKEELAQIKREIEAQRESLSSLRESIVQEANQEGERIINEAQQKASQIVHDGETKREQIMEVARQEGFRIGQEEGFKSGQAAAKEFLSQCEKILLEAQKRQTHLLEEAEKGIVELAILIAEKIIKKEMEQDKELILEVVRGALNRINEQGEVVVLVNSRDLGVVSEYKSQFLKEFSRVSNLKIREDTSIEPGGCKIVTNFGIIDAQISTQLDQIKEKLLEKKDKIKKVIDGEEG